LTQALKPEPYLLECALGELVLALEYIILARREFAPGGPSPTSFSTIEAAQKSLVAAQRFLCAPRPAATTEPKWCDLKIHELHGIIAAMVPDIHLFL
jgi:hypothetical protein